MSKNKVLVTGASGFVGTRLTASLAARDYEVAGISIEDGDIASMPLDLPGVNHVFHLAARMFVPDSWKNPQAFYQTNVMGAVNILELCRRQQASLTLMSSYVYGEPRQLPISEDHPLAAFNPYSQTKILAEEIGQFYERYFNVRLTIVRPFNIYGPGQDARFLIPSLIQQAMDPLTPAITVADKRPKRDYIHVDDVISLLIATYEKTASGTYNAGSGVSTSIEELVAVINRVTRQNKELVSRGEQRPGEVMDVIADVSRARNELDWSPRWTLESGIANMLA